MKQQRASWLLPIVDSGIDEAEEVQILRIQRPLKFILNAIFIMNYNMDQHPYLTF